MFEIKLNLKNYEDVKNFVDITNSYDFDIELLSGKYIVNAKSIMGVFSLDLTKPITMRAHCESNTEIHHQVMPFVCNENKK